VTAGGGVLAVFDAALEASEVRELCLRWGNAHQRHANLDRLRAHALAFLTRCADEQRTPTLPGLVVGLLQLASGGDDAQATPVDQDAISAHDAARCQGLEWPIVLMHGLDRKLEPDVFGAHLMNDEDVLRFEAPLEGRWIRYWPESVRERTDEFRWARVAQGHAGPRAHRDESERAIVAGREERELLRLLYVGWTRARDRLVIVTKADKLLDHDWGLFRDAKGQPILSEHESSGPVTWAGHTFDLRVREMVASPPMPEPVEADAGHPLRERREHPPAHVMPSSLEQVGRAGTPERLLTAMRVERTEDYFELGEAIHAFLAGDRATDAPEKRAQLAEEQLKAYGVQDHVAPATLARAAEALRAVDHDALARGGVASRVADPARATGPQRGPRLRRSRARDEGWAGDHRSQVPQRDARRGARHGGRLSRPALGVCEALTLGPRPSG
jgi:hypothetical protein